MKTPEDILNRFAALFGVATARGLPLHGLTLDDLDVLEAAITRKPKYLVTRDLMGQQVYVTHIRGGIPSMSRHEEGAATFATLAAAEVIAGMCDGTIHEIKGR